MEQEENILSGKSHSLECISLLCATYYSQIMISENNIGAEERSTSSE
jgi:hypothetical protein